MPPFRYSALAITFAWLAVNPQWGSAQSYPSKPVRLIAGSAGGAADFGARVLAQGVSAPLGQQMIVDNRPSGLTAEIVAKTVPDGYTLLFASSNTWLAPFLREKIAYDPVRDLAPITLATLAPNVVVVHPSVPVKSIKELITLARAHPGQLNYASSNIGGASHLAAELFKSMAGVNIMHIPYKGAGPAITDLVSGQVQLMFAAAGGVAPHIKSGRLRSLAVTTSQPSTLFPGLPTVAASGLSGYEAVSLNGVFAPAKTSDAIIVRLNLEMVRFLSTAEAKERFRNAGTETVASSPEEFAATIKAEMARLGKVIKDNGIRED